jgi:ABC-type uncharacterized transport system permease subunit
MTTFQSSNEAPRSLLRGASFLLIKPISPYGVWFSRDLGSKAFLFMLGLLGYLTVFFFFRNYLIFFPGVGYCVYFLLSLILAALLQFLLFQGLSLLSFWLKIHTAFGSRCESSWRL